MGNRVVNFVPIKQGVYEQSSTAKGDLGSVMEFEDGRKFVYSKAGEELTVGTFCQGPVENSSGYDEELVIATTGAVGGKTISLTLQRDWTANLMKDGYLVVEDETADSQGTVRKIKSHPAASSGASCEITLYDAFVAAATASTDTVTVLQNPYSGVLENNTSTTDGPLLGLPARTVTSAYYFWLQVAGIAACATGENSIVVGAWVVVDATAGLLMLPDTAYDAEWVGRAMNSCDTQGNMCLIWLHMGR